MLWNAFNDEILDLGVQVMEGSPAQVRAYLEAHPELQKNDNIVIQVGRTRQFRSVRDYLEGR